MTDLSRRIAFTLGALLVYRFGNYIPIPGLDPQALGQMFNHNRTGVLGMASTSAGAIGRLSIFSLGITSYISAAIIIQLVALVSARFNAIGQRGETGRRTMGRYTLGLAVVLIAFQAFGIATALQNIANLVHSPGALFVLTTTATLTCGSIFLIWLSEQITMRGIGNGLALLLCTGIVMEMAATAGEMLQLSKLGLLSVGGLVALALLVAAMAAAMVFVERARRHVPVQYQGRKLGDRSIPPRQSSLALKLNNAGLIPAVIAPWFFYLPLTIAGLAYGANSTWLTTAFKEMQPGRPGHLIFTVLAVVVLALIYTAFVIDPERTAESLQSNGGVIPGIAPGEATADHVDHVVSYMTFAGAAYLIAVLLLPEALIAYAKVPYYFGGASLLIVVCVVLDIEAQVRGGLLAARGGEYS